MKFKDYKYERIDIEKIKKDLELQTQNIKNAQSFEEALKAYKEINEIEKHVDTMVNLVTIRSDINTDDSFYEEERNFLDENLPELEEYQNNVGAALINSNYKQDFINMYGNHIFELLEARQKSFSPSIVEELKEENKLISSYYKLLGSAKIFFDNKELNLSKMTPYSQSLNRETRINAEKSTWKWFEENAEKFDSIYDNLVRVRTVMAKKLGFENFIPLGYLRLQRTDYTASDVKEYRKQVREDLLPVVEKIYENKSKLLNIKDLKSYDLSLSFPTGNPTPKGDTSWQVDKALQMYKDMSKETGEFFEYMINHQLMDLESKKGKTTGGYCTYIHDYNSPFIFANFNGTSGDVNVLTHEAGHAFQVYTSSHFDLMDYYWGTYETSEIHSMSMEFFSHPYLNLFFKEDTQKAIYEHVEGTLTFIPYGTLVDEFQHYVYEHYEDTPAMRKEMWRKLETIYQPYKVYDNEFLNKGTYWYRQSHIFGDPFYYIDYTLAQVCAQQFWIMDMESHSDAWEKYYKLCYLGGSKSFVKLLDEVGLDNPFKPGTVKKVSSKLSKWLDDFDLSKIK